MGWTLALFNSVSISITYILKHAGLSKLTPQFEPKASITEMDCSTLRAHVLILSEAITARLISAHNSPRRAL